MALILQILTDQPLISNQEKNARLFLQMEPPTHWQMVQAMPAARKTKKEHFFLKDKSFLMAPAR